MVVDLGGGVAFGKERGFLPADMSGNRNWLVKITRIVFSIKQFGGWTLEVNG